MESVEKVAAGEAAATQEGGIYNWQGCGRVTEALWMSLLISRA